VLLAARMELDVIMHYLNWKTLWFLLILVFIIRPAAVFISTIGSNLKIREKIFLSGIAPRGIVAAAVSSLFALRLSDAGFYQSEELVPLTFIVIVFTVTVYSLTGKTLARLLNLKPQEKGVLIVGAHSFARQLAILLRNVNVPTLLVDTDKENILLARQEGLRSLHGNMFSKKISEEIEVSTMGKLVAITASDETNLLAVMEYSEVFGRKNAFRLYTSDRQKELAVQGNSGQFLFGKGVTYTYLKTKQTAGAEIKKVHLTEKNPYSEFKKTYPHAIPLFLINRRKQLVMITEEKPVKASYGQTLLFISS